MPKKVEETFHSQADGLEISVLALLPDGKKEEYRGIVQLVHGMSEHKERYLPFMEYLAEKGYVTVIHDHRGHGKSIRREEDLGYMYGGGAKAMLTDIHTVNKKIRDRFKNLPLILFGHSMGSLAVRAYAASHADRMRFSKQQPCPSLGRTDRQNRNQAIRPQTQKCSFGSPFLWKLCRPFCRGTQQKCLDLFRERGSGRIRQIKALRIYLYRRRVSGTV